MVGSNPVPPSEVNVGINTRLKPQQEPTGCSNWIVSMIGIKKNEQLEDKGIAIMQFLSFFIHYDAEGICFILRLGLNLLNLFVFVW